MSCKTSLRPRTFLHNVQVIIRFLWGLAENMSLRYFTYCLPRRLHSINRVTEEELVVVIRGFMTGADLDGIQVCGTHVSLCIGNERLFSELSP